MSNKGTKIVRWCRSICLLLCAFLPWPAFAQQNIVINMAAIDGVPITPDNIFNYQVHASAGGMVTVRGTIRYRNSGLNLSYTSHCYLQPGLNTFSADMVHPQWQFSSSALQELFMTYKTLPEGTFEYCVLISSGTIVKEHDPNVFEECLYHRANDIFLINLISPANKEKLKEYNPMLSWVANYSFSSELTYRIRVAEMKQGQNPVNAVLRNQPVYDEKNLLQNSIVYPTYAKPLVANQPYAWTVDAYYKGILLGGAETWEFIIPDDTLPTRIPAQRSYIDVKRENGTSRLNILGDMKLKYTLDKQRTDVLTLQLFNEGHEEQTIKPQTLNATYGDNRYVLHLREDCNLKHKREYILILKSKTGEVYSIPFKYFNPDLTK